MKNKTMIRHARQLTLGLALVAAAGSASATTWTFHGGSVINNGPNGSFREATVTADGITGTATAWANTHNSANVLLAKAYLTDQNGSGMGISHADNETTNSPDHAIDNSGRQESVLFSFSDKVNLTSSYFGWIDTDSDFSVYAYTGAGVGTVAGFRYGDTLANTDELTDNGWKLIGNYSEQSQPDKGYTSNLSGSSTFKNKGDTKEIVPAPGASPVYSSYWLIGAYNGAGADNTKDYFKLKTVSGVKYTAPPCTNGNCGGTGQAPEPGTLLLMGAGLFGLSRFNARRPLRFAA